MAKKKTSKTLYVAYQEGCEEGAHVGSLKECEEIAADWYADDFYSDAIHIATLTPLKCLQGKASAPLPWTTSCK